MKGLTERQEDIFELRVAKAEAVKFERMWKATVGELKWRKKQLENLNLWTQENCTCGGGGPETGCLACQAYHVAGLKGMGE